MGKMINALAGTLALMAVHGAALAESASPSVQDVDHRQVLPVLVKVDAKGRISGVNPAFRLSPRLNRLLEDNLQEIVTAPANSKDGRAISSQFIANMALTTLTAEDGSQAVQFTYVSSQSIPRGEWSWAHVDNRRLALMNRDQPVRGGERFEPSFRSMNPPKAPNTGGSEPPPAGGGQGKS